MSQNSISGKAYKKSDMFVCVFGGGGGGGGGGELKK